MQQDIQADVEVMSISKLSDVSVPSHLFGTHTQV